MINLNSKINLQVKRPIPRTKYDDNLESKQTKLNSFNAELLAEPTKSVLYYLSPIKNP